MKIIRYITLVFAVAMLSTACSKHTVELKNTSNAYTNFETTCMGSEGDGSQTLRAWGKGSNEADAIEQAKKTAVYDVIFKGIKGQGDCNKRALVNEVNARERYENYFDPFFSDGGEYKKFVKEEQTNKASRLKIKGSGMNQWGIIVTVDRPALRQQLIRDGILAE